MSYLPLHRKGLLTPGRYPELLIPEGTVAMGHCLQASGSWSLACLPGAYAKQT